MHHHGLLRAKEPQPTRKCCMKMLMMILIGSFSVSYVTTNVVGQSAGVPGNSTAITGLTERSVGPNSRYLSAASTASLAAATLVASNGIPQASSTSHNSNSNGSGSSSANSANQANHEANRNYQQHLAHNQAYQQAQQQQQQPQQSPNQVALSPSQSLNHVSQSPQYNALQSQQAPVVATTLTLQNGQANGNFATNGQPFNQHHNIVTSGLLGPQQLAYNNNNFQQQQQQQQTQLLPYQGLVWNPYQTNRLAQPAFDALGFNRRAGLLQQQQQQQQQPYGSRYSSVYGQSNQLPFPTTSNLVNSNNIGVDDDPGYFLSQLNQNQINQLPGQNQNSLDFGSSSSSLSNNFGIPNGFPNYPGQSGAHFNELGSLSGGYQQQQQHLQLPFGTPTYVASTQHQQGAIPASWSTADQCIAADGRHGTCYLASECIRRGGTPMGKCGASSASGPGLEPFGGGQGARQDSNVCCLFDVTCGQFAAERFVYFRNPNYPNTFDQARTCRAKVGKLDKGVCQFRLDLHRFDIAKPTNGNCSHDMFVVSGQNENNIIPKICGFNDGQHYYVGVDESGVITLHMMLMGSYYRRSFDILITQVPCRSDYASPSHCLQYYTGTHGTIKSFNYEDDSAQQANHHLPLNGLIPSSPGDLAADSSLSSPLLASNAPYGLHFNQVYQQRQGQIRPSYGQQHPSGPLLGTDNHFAGYPNDLDYAMCIRKESGFCSITYQLTTRPELPSQWGSNWPQSPGGGSNWQPGECRDDFLLVGSTRLCSQQHQQPFGSFQQGFEGVLPGPYLQSNSLNGSSVMVGGQPPQAGQIVSSPQFVSSSTQTLSLSPQQMQQYNLLLQQLARIQQASASLNSSHPITSGLSGQSISNLEQQQAAIVQQLNQLANINNNNNSNGSNLNNINLNKLYQQQFGDGQFTGDLAVITDSTSGPFMVRFVSNVARNARGFYIEYRQNPCK